MALPEIKIIISAVGDKLDAGVKSAERRLDGLRGASDRAAARLATLGDRLDRLGRHMSVVSAGIVAGGGAIFALAQKAAAAGDEIGDLSAAAGVSTDYFQEMTFALEQAADMTDEEVAAAMSKLTRTLGEAQGGSKAATEALKKLGYSEKEIAAGTITTEEAMDRFVTTVSGMKTPTEASALAVDLLGKSGAKTGAMLAGTGDNVQNLRDRARELGVVLSDRAIKASEDFSDSMVELKSMAEAAFVKIGSELLPLFTETLVPALRDKVIPAVMALGDHIADWVAWFNDLPSGIKTAIGGFAALAAALGPVLMVAGALASGLSALAMFISPIGVVIAAVGALAAAWIAFGDDIIRVVGEAVDFVLQKFDELLAKLKEVKTWVENVGKAFTDMLPKQNAFMAAAGNPGVGAAGAGGWAADAAANWLYGDPGGAGGNSTGRNGMGSQSGGGMSSVGYNMAGGLVDGFVAGMGERWPELLETLERVTTVAREVFQVNSPSKVFAQIGAWLGQGLADGIGSSTGVVADAIGKTAKIATDATQSMASRILSTMGELFRGSKAIAIAQALVNTWEGATQALKLPWPENLLAFGKTLATGLQAVRNIRGTNVGSGSGGGAASGSAGGGAEAAPPQMVQTFNFSVQNDPFGIGEGIVRQLSAALNNASRSGVLVRSRVN